ncbi:MAG: hypothetical protein FJ271_22800 [Planctomycetes bacterium]|nr:hypothetical protein [Planctomycetota bacterium]
MAEIQDIQRIERNVRRMIDLGAPAEDIDAYLGEEGTTQEAFRAAMIERRPPKDDRGFMERSGRALALGTRHVAEGLASPFLAVNDAIGGAVGLGSGQQTFSRALDYVFPRPETPSEKFVGRVAEGGAAALAPMGAARAVGQALGPVGRSVAQAMQTAPSAQMSAGVGAGLGGATSQALFPGNPYADLGLSLAGGVGGSVVPAVAGAVRQAVPSIFQPFTQRGQQEIVGRVLRDSSSSPETLVSRLDDAIATPPRVAGSRATTAEIATDPGLATLERGVRQSVPNVSSDFALREAERNTVRQAALREIGGDGPGAPAVAEVIAARRAALENEGRMLAEDLTDYASRKAQELGPGVAPEMAGGTIRKIYDKALAKAKIAVRNAYDLIDPDGSSSIQIFGVKRAAQDAKAKYFGEGSGGASGQIKTLLDTVEGIGDNKNFAPWRVLQSVRAQANAVLGSAAAQEDPRIASVARQIKDAVDAASQAAAEKGGSFTTDQAAAWRRATSLRKEMGETFQRGASDRIGQMKAPGEPKVPTSAVPGQFFNSGRGAFEDAAMFRKTFGDNPKAMQALIDSAVFDLRRAATGADGVTLDAKRLDGWLKSNRAALQQFPELSEKVSTAARAQKLVDEAVARNGVRLAELDKSAAGVFLKQDPDAAVATILGRKSAQKDMADLIGSLGGDQRALSGLRRAVLDHALDKARVSTLDAAGNQSLSPARFAAFVADNEATLKPLFSASHMAALKNIARDMLEQTYPATAGTVRGSPTYQNMTTANFLARVTGGLVDPNNSFVASVMRPVAWLYKVPQQQMERLLSEAMLDPSLARGLAAKATPTDIRRLGDVLKARVTATMQGATAAALTSPMQE